MPRREWERRYISQYLMETWPEGGWQLNIELGPIPQDYVDRYGLGKAAAIYRPTRPRVDAVKWTPERYYLLESKIRDIKTGIGDLIHYRSIVPDTPDLPFYNGQPVVCRLVVPWMLDWVMASATSNQIEVAVVSYDWIDDYVKERQNYFTAEYREARAKKMELRRVLGVD